MSESIERDTNEKKQVFGKEKRALRCGRDIRNNQHIPVAKYAAHTSVVETPSALGDQWRYGLSVLVSQSTEGREHTVESLMMETK